MRIYITALVAALALGTGIAVAQTSPMPAMSAMPDASPAASSTTPAPASSPGNATIIVVHIKNFAFSPANVTVPAGAMLRFIEDDETPHTVTAADKSFDSGNMNQHDKWDHVFATAGTYPYICAYHPYMKGTVTVK